MEERSLVVEPLSKRHRPWANDLLTHSWGSTKTVSRGRLYDASQLPGFVAVIAGEWVGLVTYRIEDRECELTTLNSLRPKLGIGSRLVETVREVAANAGCNRLWLITTNDNTVALRFYQRLGFRLVALHRDALIESRCLKPEIPLVGMDEIPLRDELELEWMLD